MRFAQTKAVGTLRVERSSIQRSALAFRAALPITAQETPVVLPRDSDALAHDHMFQGTFGPTAFSKN